MDHDTITTAVLVERTRQLAEDTIRGAMAAENALEHATELEIAVLAAMSAAKMHGSTPEAMCGASRAVQQYWSERHPVH